MVSVVNMAASMSAFMRIMRLDTFLHQRGLHAISTLNIRCASSTPRSEYTDSVQYPPIHDETIHGRYLRRQKERHERYRDLPTMEEKLHDLVNSKMAFAVKFDNLPSRYNTLPLRQHCMRTHVVRDQLPPMYDSQDVDTVCASLKPFLEEAILMAWSRQPLEAPGEPPLAPDQKERLRATRTIDHILRVLVTGLAKDNPHLQDIQIDLDPRSESFWYCGAFPPDKRKKSIREKCYPDFARPNLDDPVDLCFLYKGTPHVQIRSRLPLPKYVEQDDALCTKTVIPEFPYDPRSVGQRFIEQYPTMLPGFWPGDPYDFAHTSFHTREGFKKRRSYLGILDEDDALLEYGMLASFGWLMAIATFQGFGPHIEVTYPLATQTVVTDGKNWKFFAYQMNTICLSGKVQDNPQRNICWSSKDMALFESVDNDKVVGLNEDVLKLLIKFISTEPVSSQINLKPYLSGQSQLNEMEWSKMDTQLRDWYSQRPPHKPKRELYQWERIYLKTGSYLSINPNRKRD